MIVDTFLEWSRHAPTQRRIEAGDALARSYLHSALSDTDRRKVMTGLFALLDDPCADVRARLAEVFADRRDAPRALILRLVDDLPGVCAPLFARSPLLQSDHLLEALQRCDRRLDIAIASRMDLDENVLEAVLSGGDVEACKVLVSNPYVRLRSAQIEAFILRFSGDVDALQVLQANRTLLAEHQCLLVTACARSYQANDFVRALVPGKRLERLTDAARERAILEVMAQLDAHGCWRAIGTLYPLGAVTPAFAVRAALCGQVCALEALVARLSDVSMERVRSAFVHPRPVVAATLLKKTGLPSDVRLVLSMALVLARELAQAQVEWTPVFFAEMLVEVVDQRSAQNVIEGADPMGPSAQIVALCHSIAADITQVDARAQAGRAGARGERAMLARSFAPADRDGALDMEFDTDMDATIQHMVAQSLEAGPLADVDLVADSLAA